MYAKLLGFGVVYGFGFTLVKSLFPTPVLLFLFAEGPSTEGNLTVLTSVYLASGLQVEAGGFRAAPSSDLWRSLVLSFGFAILIGFISGFLMLGAYLFGVLPSGGILDPLRLIRSSNFPPGYPLLVAWALARDLLPAMLAGLFLAPLGGDFLYRIYASRRPPKDASQHGRSIEDDF